MRVLLAFLLTALAWLAPAQAQGVLPVPELTARVVDQADTLDAIQRQGIEDKLAAFEQKKGTQIVMLLVLMVSSKGIAGVPRSALVVVAAVLPMFNLPEAGVLLIMGIDHFLDMGRTATNVLGNAIATTVVAKWENALDIPDEAEQRTRERLVAAE